MKSLHQTYKITAPIHDVWQALVNPSDIDAWGGGLAKMTELPNHDFSLWGGDIWGKNKTVEREKKLAQEWYGGKWDKPSIVTFELSDDGKGTKVELTHTDIPDDAFKDIEEGWKDSYMGPLKEYIEGK